MINPNRRFSLLLCLLVTILLAGLPGDAAAQSEAQGVAQKAQQNDPLDYLDRNLNNAATRPFGMLQWDANRVFFLYGAGCGRPDLLKIIASTSADAGGLGMRGGALGSPGYWAGEWGNPQEHAVARRSGIARYLFSPDSQKGYIYLRSDSGGASGAQGATPGKIEAVGDTRVRGVAYQSDFCGHGQAPVHLFWDIEFDQPFVAADMVKLGKNKDEGWMRVTFELPKEIVQVDRSTIPNRDTRQDGKEWHQIRGRLGVSWTKAENARLNVTTEIPEWDFDKVLKEACDDWRERLRAFDVEEAPEWVKKHIYMRMYYTAIHPNLYSDVNGEFMGFDNEIHTVRDPEHEVYHIFSGWDTYRTHMPFVSMVWPDIAEDIAQTFVYQAETGGGGFARWSIGNRETGTMMGDPSTPMIATAYAYGARGFDTEAALEAMVRVASTPELESSPGYHSRPGLDTYLKQGNTVFAPTVDYTRGDFALSRMAKQMGRDDLADYFLKQSNNFKSLANPGMKRLADRDADGDSINKQTYRGVNGEGWNFQYQFHPWHNLPFIWEAMGGSEMAEKKLDAHMRHFLPEELWTFDPDAADMPADLAEWVKAQGQDKMEIVLFHNHNEHGFHTPML